MKSTGFIKHLTYLGFSEKEARVYLACLEIGPTSVAAVAELAGVKRPTAYVMLNLLVKRGLVGSAKGGKKGMVRALNPKRVLEMLEEEKKVVELKHGVFSMILPELMAVAPVVIEE